MKSSPMIPIVFVFGTLTLASPVGGADGKIPARMRSSLWQPVKAPWRELSLREGRAFYRGPRSLRNQYPFLLVASKAEREEGFGYELRIENAHQLLEPIRTRAGAEEVGRLFAGGNIVRDFETYKRIREAVTPLMKAARRWPIRILDGHPERAGIHIERMENGWSVVLLVFTSSDFGALNVEEQRYRISLAGSIEREVTTWIAGPPASWQTSGKVDETLQAAMAAEVDAFRTAVTRCLSASRSISDVKTLVQNGEAFSSIRWKLGEPDGDIGSGLHVYVYGLADGTALMVGTGSDDSPPSYARHVRISTNESGKPVRTETIEEIPVGGR